MDSILDEALVLISAAVIVIPLFRWMGLGAILGYLCAGAAIGPHALGLIHDAEVIMHFSELGVVFLLFIIGLELAPSKLWKMRMAIFGMGGMQVGLTGGLFTFVAVSFNVSLPAAVIGGFGLALSSTAFALQILEEKRQLHTTHGQGSFSILMFQDLAVIPLMGSVALFAGVQGASLDLGSVIKILGVLALYVFVGRQVVRHILRFVAESRTQEIFIGLSLLIVLGSAVLLESIGLSMGMGAFLAGVLLAESEYRHE